MVGVKMCVDCCIGPLGFSHYATHLSPRPLRTLGQQVLQVLQAPRTERGRAPRTAGLSYAYNVMQHRYYVWGEVPRFWDGHLFAKILISWQLLVATIPSLHVRMYDCALLYNVQL